MTKPQNDFSFAEHAHMFDHHIKSSIPSYRQIVSKVTRLSRSFIQPHTCVYDAGCATGDLLARIRRENRASRSGVRYVGIDCEPGFDKHWAKRRARDLSFKLGDVRTWPYEKASLVTSLFTIQFIPPMDKRDLLKRFHHCLVEGGALMIAEKTFAETARLQDALTFPYYDEKLERGFTSEQILQKQRQLRGQMTLWDEPELREALRQAGFREIERIGGDAPFAAFVALN